MLKSGINFNDYVSLAVMLLMVVALVSGQADASADHENSAQPVIEFADFPGFEAIDPFVDAGNIRFQGYLNDQALKLSIDIAADLSQFRGEDE